MFILSVYNSYTSMDHGRNIIHGLHFYQPQLKTKNPNAQDDIRLKKWSLMHNRYPVLHRNTVYFSIVLSSQKEAPQTKGQTGRAANTLGYQRSRALSFKGNTNTRNVCLCCQQDRSWYSGYKKNWCTQSNAGLWNTTHSLQLHKQQPRRLHVSNPTTTRALRETALFAAPIQHHKPHERGLKPYDLIKWGKYYHTSCLCPCALLLSLLFVLHFLNVVSRVRV